MAVRQVLLVVLGISLASGVGALADDTAEQVLAKQALFKVSVEGLLSTPPNIREEFEGRAFAIEEDVLFTARHVTGDRTLWKTKSDGLLYVPERTVTLETALAYGAAPDLKEYPEAFVTPAPIETVDAARLNVLDLDARAFKLSACPIDDQKTYRALMLPDGQLGQPEFFTLNPEKYRSTKYGNVYVFENPAFQTKLIGKGDSGTPVLDDANRVIGLVSGISGDSTGSEVLVTAVRDFVALIPPEVADVDCDPRVSAKRVAELETGLRTAELRADLAVALIRYKSDLAPDAIKKVLEEIGTTGGAGLEGENIDEIIEKHISPMDMSQKERADLVIAFLRERFGLEPSLIENVFDKFPPDHTVYSRIDVLSKELKDRFEELISDLSRETWEMQVSTLSEDVKDTIIIERYIRDIEAAPFSTAGYLCVHPILPMGTLGLKFPEGKDYADLIEFPPDSDYYFRLIDLHYDLERCLHSYHQSPAQTEDPPSSDTAATTRIGSYTFSLSKERVKEHAEHDDWDGRYYVQFIAQETNGDHVGAEESERTIVSRYLWKVNEDDLEVIGCEPFNSDADVFDYYKRDSEMTSSEKKC